MSLDALDEVLEGLIEKSLVSDLGGKNRETVDNLHTLLTPNELTYVQKEQADFEQLLLKWSGASESEQKELADRFRAVENVCDLYEALAAMIGTMASLSKS